MKLPILAALAPVLLLASVVSVVAVELSPEDVQKAMHKGVAYLENEWQDHGKWSDYGGQDGVTCLCTLALLNAGETPDDQHAYLKSALDRVRKLRPTTTYVVSLQTMVLCRLDKLDRDQDIIAHNVDWLQETQITAGVADDRNGGWSYGDNGPGPKSAQGDGSNSQFALLALYEAARAAEKHHLHIKISREKWEHARSYWIGNQVSNGGWGYYKGMEPTGSMTCAGISSLVICGDMLHEPDAKVTGDTIDGCFRASSAERDCINRGIEWLRLAPFTVQANPPAAAGNVRLWHYYYLYGLERAGRLSARRKIGDYDWYREGANQLVRTINADLMNSFWRGSGFAENEPDITTSLALLFLSKGRWPALMAKVQFGDPKGWLIRDADKQWNWHRNDVNNLTINVESRWGFEMTWQEIDINKANVDEMLQVPVLFFSGNGNPLPKGEVDRKRLVENLRDYIDRGGFIFADGGEACEAGGAEFDKGFRQLMELVFQKPEYRFKDLDASHPVWAADEPLALGQERTLQGIDYGCRTSVIYAPYDAKHPRPSLACLWDLSRSEQRETYSKSVQDQIKGGLVIGRNVLAYATNRELPPREYAFQNKVTKVVPDKERGKFAIAKLSHLGGCDAAPRALANLMEQAAKDLHIRVDAHPQLIGINQGMLDYSVVFMHGRNAFRLTDLERQALREYVERGGVLFADAICGSEPFAESFRNEMAIIFPKNPLMSIPGTDPIWTTKYGGYDLSLVTRRDPQPGARGEGLKATSRRVPPEFKAVRIGDRYGVIFSEFDLSCAFEKHDSLECRGYTRDDAARIGINIIRYAMQQ